MRLWLLVLLVMPTLAFAKPTVAVAPFEDDDGNKVANGVARALEEDAEVIKPKDTGKAMAKLDLSGMVDKKDGKKLRSKLGADVLVQGKVEGDGSDRSVLLRVAGKGIKSGQFKVRFKSAGASSFRDDVREAYAKRVTDGGDDDDDAPAFKRRGDDDDDDDDDDDRKKKKDAEEAKRKAAEEAERERKAEALAREAEEADRKKKRDDEARRKRGDDDDDDDDGKRRKRLSDNDDDDGDAKRRKRLSDDDDDDDKRGKRGKRVADDDDDDDDVAVRKKKKRRRGGDDDEDRPRHPTTQAALLVHAGAAFGRRSLTYDATGTMIPPRVGTAAGSGRIEAEVYPASFSTLKGIAAGLGVYGSFDRTVGLSINVPLTPVDAPISQGHYAIGARYRYVVGSSSVAAGVGYARRHYIADRSGLPMPTSLDAPDVDYSAINPNVIARIAANPKAGVFVGAGLLLMLDAGPIVKSEQYGFAKITAFEMIGGLDYAFTPRYGLHVALEFTQVGFAFTKMTRGVTAATDRQIGLTASFAMTY